jgi:hypothetical protein
MSAETGGEEICAFTDKWLHSVGRTISECERHIRTIEQAGGSGQLLTAVKADHQVQLSGTEPMAVVYEDPECAVVLPDDVFDEVVADKPVHPHHDGRCQDWGHEPPVVEAVDHPAHYGGDSVYEVVKVCEAWGLDGDAYLFNVIKYVGRPAKGNYLEDLKKARWYLDRRIASMEKMA